MLKYIELKENDRKATHLKVEVYYTKGGMNCWTSREEKRGYYLLVTPVERRKCNGYSTETYTAFSGIKLLVKEVARKSNKAEKEAEKIAEVELNGLIDYVCKKQNLEIKETFEVA